MMEYNGGDFKKEVATGLTIVDFYAVWCGPCQMIAPVLVEFASENPDIKVIKVNTDEYPTIAQQHGVMSIPTLALYKDGEVVGIEIGFKSKEMLQEWTNANK